MKYVQPLGAAADAPYVDANPAAGIEGSAVPAAAIEHPMREIEAVITAAGLTPSSTELTQLLQAIIKIARQDIQSITATVAANALVLGLNATSLDFRSSSLTSGTPNKRIISAPLSLVVPSGATLGTVSGQSARLVMIAIDNAGAVELAVVNLAGGKNLDETTLISTTAISASATSSNVFYSTTARASVPFRVVGFVDITEVTAGTWATAPTTVQGGGGQALAALSSLGYGQTWQAVTRAAGTTYYNTTGRPIFASWSFVFNAGTNANWTINGVPNNSPRANPAGTGGQQTVSMEILIPPGASYSLNITTGSATLSYAFELR
ncbi:hypothetical protein [Rhodocyclus purpureus]|uniref:hypothetical protein n=1 Tax=Rhodocyclus purpureus TaxID=1067 RepID=UPI0019142EE5|nr:hypothetical protein [Rhodocyclus purpureus]